MDSEVNSLLAVSMSVFNGPTFLPRDITNDQAEVAFRKLAKDKYETEACSCKEEQPASCFQGK